MRRRMAPLVLALLAAPLAPAAPAAAATTSFLWQAPLDLSGNLVVELTFAPHAPAPCTFRLLAEGTAGGDSALELFVGDSTGAWAYARHGALVRAHALGAEAWAVDAADGGEVRWAARAVLERFQSGPVTFTIAAFDLLHWPNPIAPRPFLVEMTCGAPLDVGPVRAGRHALSFLADTMRGGAGASARPFFSLANIQALDHTGATFEAAGVRLAVRTLQFDAVSAGLLRLDTPAGPQEFAFRGNDAIDVASEGPGRYDVTITRAAAGLGDALVGVLAGVDAVASLDDVIDP